MPSEVADPSSETISLVTGAIPLRATDEAEDRLEASAAKEELPASELSTVFSLPAAAPVTLTLASATLPPLKPRQSAVLSFAPACRKIPAPPRPLRLKVADEARDHAGGSRVRRSQGSRSGGRCRGRARADDARRVARRAEARHLSGHQACGEREDLKRHARYDTKMGVFSILEKKRRHHSNLYSGAPMPFMQRLTRSGTALHAGAIPGYPASHGCVRLPYSFAPKLFEMTSVGHERGGDARTAGADTIEHPNLFELLRPSRKWRWRLLSLCRGF